jgi:hypothetical protein
MASLQGLGLGLGLKRVSDLVAGLQSRSDARALLYLFFIYMYHLSSSKADVMVQL